MMLLHMTAQQAAQQRMAMQEGHCSLDLAWVMKTVRQQQQEEGLARGLEQNSSSSSSKGGKQKKEG
jgi:energy-converting hydrogenase A subunit M